MAFIKACQTTIRPQQKLKKVQKIKKKLKNQKKQPRVYFYLPICTCFCIFQNVHHIQHVFIANYNTDTNQQMCHNGLCLCTSDGICPCTN